MKRISKELKAIADAHMEAKMSGNWNPAQVETMQELADAMKKGHTFETVFDNIEISYCSITSLIAAGVIGHNSKAYRDGVYKGFRVIMGPFM